VLVTRRNDQHLYDFTTGEECTLTSNGSLLLSKAFSDAEQVVFHPALAFAYVTDPHLHEVFEVGVNPDLSISLVGEVTPPLSSPEEPGPLAPVVHPSGNFLYVADATASGVEISEFTIGAGGLLTWSSSVTQGVSDPSVLRIDASGKFLYAANFAEGTIATFSIDPDTGALTPNPPPPGTNTIPVAATSQQLSEISWMAATH
jgi:6-phosphogluconolactonase (cycloisomerase 2 family)